MDRLHITDLEAALNHWRAAPPAAASGALAPEVAALAEGLVAFGKRHEKLPMVGRTHLQPAMPSSVGLWATAYAESLLDDLLAARRD